MRLIRNNKAFTLVEILIVVAILGLLAAIAIPNLMRARTGGVVETCRANRATIHKAIAAYMLTDNISAAAANASLDILGDTIAAGFLQAGDAACPLDGTAYTASVASNGRITVTCGGTHAM